MRQSASREAKDLANQIALLRAQLDEVAESVSESRGSLAEKGQEALEETLKATRELIARYGDSARALAEDAGRLRQRAAERIVEQAEARPLTTVAAIAGIGILLGYLLRRR